MDPPADLRFNIILVFSYYFSCGLAESISALPVTSPWRSFVRPVGTTQGAGSVTAVPTYIMWLMAAIPIVEATANTKKTSKLFFVTLREKSQVRYQLPSSENPGGP